MRLGEVVRRLAPRSTFAGLATVVAAQLFVSPAVRAQSAEPAVGAGIPALPADPVLSRLIEQSLSARPELAQAQSAAKAERERVPQAGALPDPTLQLGIQNDGFTSIEIGEMETSYYSISASQTVPWPGKRRLRGEVAELGAKQADTNVSRLRLSTEADVRRAYLELVLARERLALLDRLEAIWQKSAGIARTRYEAGEGAQSDVLRAQLELNRIRQRRWTLQAQERGQLQALNRLRGHPLDEPIETGSSLRDQPVPGLADERLAMDDAMTRSPELAAARLGLAQAERSLGLAEKSYFPDLTFSAGVMPRGGEFPPMWQVGIGGTLPVFAGRKQNRAVAESEARAAADRKNAEAIEQVLGLRIRQRRTSLEAALENIRLYRDGLLVQSRATTESTLAQYQVGKVSFASVLEANAGYIADEDGYLQALAEAQRIGIASAELSLDPVGGAAAGGLGATAMPGAGAVGGSGSGAAAEPAAGAAEPASAPGPMSGM